MTRFNFPSAHSSFYKKGLAGKENPFRKAGKAVRAAFRFQEKPSSTQHSFSPPENSPLENQYIPFPTEKNPAKNPFLPLQKAMPKLRAAFAFKNIPPKEEISIHKKDFSDDNQFIPFPTDQKKSNDDNKFIPFPPPKDTYNTTSPTPNSTPSSLPSLPVKIDPISSFESPIFEPPIPPTAPPTYSQVLEEMNPESIPNPSLQKEAEKIPIPINISPNTKEVLSAVTRLSPKEQAEFLETLMRHIQPIA